MRDSQRCCWIALPIGSAADSARITSSLDPEYQSQSALRSNSLLSTTPVSRSPFPWWRVVPDTAGQKQPTEISPLGSLKHPVLRSMSLPLRVVHFTVLSCQGGGWVGRLPQGDMSFSFSCFPSSLAPHFFCSLFTSFFSLHDSFWLWSFIPFSIPPPAPFGLP
jgi:hypothetical protein